MAYAKSLLAVLVTVISAVVAALTDNTVTNVEWINVAIAGAGAAAVFAAPNVPGSRYTKAILAIVTAVLTFLVTVITDGITASEWLQVLVIAAGALGVYAVPNKPTTTIGQPSVL